MSGRSFERALTDQSSAGATATVAMHTTPGVPEFWSPTAFGNVKDEVLAHFVPGRSERRV